MTDQRTCQAQMQRGKVCDRPAQYYSDTGQVACICHNSNRNKNRGQFLAELNRIFEDTDTLYYDLTGFNFPLDDWIIPRVIDKPIYFNEARFHGLTDFSFTTFEETASFTNCVFKDITRFSTGTTFCGRASFISAYFEQEANFAGCIFSCSAPADFKMAKFKKSADFMETVFEAPAIFSGVSFFEAAHFREAAFYSEVAFSSFDLSGYTTIPATRFYALADFIDTILTNATFRNTVFDSQVLFRDTRFRGIADFRYCQFFVPEKVLFEKNNLSKVLWAGADISKVIFRNVSWHWEPRKFLHSRRNIIAEEVSLRKRDKKKVLISVDEYELAAQTYRQLQQNYGESYRYPEAGDFYVGEQEMELNIRKKNNKILAVASWLYKATSNYGEDVLRPAIVITAVLVASVCYLLLSGFYLTADQRSEPEMEYVNYDLSISLDGISSFTRGQLWDNLLDALNVNLDILLLRSGAAGKHLLGSCQKLVMKVELLIIAVFLTFFILALRRKFKRKSF